MIRSGRAALASLVLYGCAAPPPPISSAPPASSAPPEHGSTTPPIPPLPSVAPSTFPSAAPARSAAPPPARRPIRITTLKTTGGKATDDTSQLLRDFLLNLALRCSNGLALAPGLRVDVTVVLTSMEQGGVKHVGGPPPDRGLMGSLAGESLWLVTLEKLDVPAGAPSELSSCFVNGAAFATIPDRTGGTKRKEEVSIVFVGSDP